MTDLAIAGGVMPTVAVAPAVTVADADNATEYTATVAITGGFQTGDVLAFSNTSSFTFGNIQGSYDAAAGVLTLTSSGATSSLAQWQAALQAVTYTDTAASPSAVDRTLSFTINDGQLNSAVATQTLHFDTPTLAGLSGVTIASGAAPAPVAVAPALTVADAGSATEASATVAITGGFHAGDVLSFTNTGGISGSYDSATGVLTLTASGATLAQWQAALRSVTYDTAASAAAGDRTLSFTINDGLINSAVASETLHFNSPPTLAGASGVTDLAIAGGVAPTPVAVAAALTVADADNTTEASATVAITGGFHAGEDVLAFTSNAATFGNIAGSYDAATGVLTLTSTAATATLAQWQAALEAVTYTDTAASPTVGDRTVSFTINDGLNASAAAEQTVHVAVATPTPSVPPPHDGQSGDMQLAAGQSLTTGDGESTVVGLGQNTITGGAGDDLLIAGPGPNVLRGGPGADVISGGPGSDTINGNQGDDTINGGSGGNDWLLGGQGNDLIYANHGANIVNGNLGDDTLHGGDGGDTLHGGQGNDLIYAGSGNNWISGDLGDNTIYGGQGMDTFHAGAGHDVVNGWHAGDHVQVDVGVTYTVTQVNADVRIVFSNGGEMDLINTQKAALQSGWIVSA